MSRLKELSVSLFLLFSPTSCATVEVPDFKAYVELPASKKGFGVTTVTHKEHEISSEKWIEKKKRAILIFSEDWLILKRTIRKNCITNDCNQAIGALDGLFLTIDQALESLDKGYK